jgi:hypothetical protein
MHSVPRRAVRWLWEGRLALGKVTILDGDPGLGKSLLSLDLIARVTTGAPMPDGSEGVGGGAVLLCAEDALDDTVGPRLVAAGADDLSRVAAMTGIPSTDPTSGEEMEYPLVLPRDVPWIERAVLAVGARLVVIDPLMAYLDGKVNSWRDQDARAALAPLIRLAREHDLAVLILRHLNKAVGGKALYRGGGSIGINGAARAAWLVAKDPEEPERTRVLAMNMNNLAEPRPSLRYRIEADADGRPRVVWAGECAYTADALVVAGDAPGTAALPDAPAGTTVRQRRTMAWLSEALSDGPCPCNELIAAGAAKGFSVTLLRQARLALGVHAHTEGYGYERRTLWALPAQPETLPPDPTPETP